MSGWLRSVLFPREVYRCPHCGVLCEMCVEVYSHPVPVCKYCGSQVTHYNMDKMIKKILVIRFRQLGDAVLSAALCSTLKRSFPGAEVHIVLNEGLAPLFAGHPDIDKVVTFSGAESNNTFKYMRKVWSVVRQGKYDVIIDQRATVRTLLFSFLSLFSTRRPLRVGRGKWYSRLLFTQNVPLVGGDMLQKNHAFATALSALAPIKRADGFNLYISDGELRTMRDYMQSRGIDLSRPVIMVGVTTKLLHKRWNMEYMREVLERLLARYRNVQLIFNYAPGREEQDAVELFKRLGSPSAVKIGVEARSLRSLMALCACCSFYFGNEGGARHIAQAVGVPSYAIFSPVADKTVWLPRTSVPAYGVGCDYNSPLTGDYNALFDAITPNVVCDELFPLLDGLLGKPETKNRNKQQSAVNVKSHSFL